MSSDFGIYIHTPWCKSRCPYCAFNVFTSGADYSRWKSGLFSAWENTAPHFEGLAHSLYFGGGTPSLAPAHVLGTLIQRLPLAENAEVTVEVNPGSIDADGLRALLDIGVNRLSLGVQTFNTQHAKTLGRGHTVRQTRKLLSQVSLLGFDSWSMDLMFCLPRQTLSELNDDLSILLDYSPPHVSLYGLTVEPNTPFDTAQQRGLLHLPEADTWRGMYDLIVDRLTQAGRDRYEVSNFSRPGHRAVQNESVWRGGFYAGLGPGAHGYLPQGSRTVGKANLEAWFADPHPILTPQSPAEAAADLILSTLRHIDGLCTLRLQKQTGFTLCESTVENLQAHRLITVGDGRIRLCHDAFAVSDGVVRRLIDTLISG
jgi:oxygen-independent coproporphyrinogen-3 oxidase